MNLSLNLRHQLGRGILIATSTNKSLYPNRFAVFRRNQTTASLMNLGRRCPGVVSRERTFAGTAAHCSIAGRLNRPGMGARRIPETLAKLARKMGIVAKAAGVGDLAQRLARAAQRAPAQQVCGMIQPKRIDIFAAGETTFGKDLLNVA
jgi:hypothetical protein